jgi:Dolichyl-phosphate-mannose-protein mannosyltransferase
MIGTRVRGALPLVPVLIAFVGFAVAYTRLTPLGQAPDELSHIGYVHGIVFDHRLPTAATPEKQQPPLYYLLASVPQLLTGDYHSVRLVSVVLSCATLVTVWMVARELFPDWRWLAVLAAATIAALPEFQYISGSVNDDALAWLAGAVIVLCLVRIMQTPRVSMSLLAAVGFAVTLAVLAKETVWLPALILAAVTLWRCRHEHLASALAWLVAPTVLLAGWWFVRNTITFHSLLPPLTPITPHRQFLSSLGQLRSYASTTADTTIGMYGPGSTLTHLALFGVWPIPSLLVVLAALVFAVALAARLARHWISWSNQQRVLFAALLVVAAATVLQLIVNSVALDLQPEGRYLLIVAALPAVGFAWLASGWAWARVPAVQWVTLLCVGVGVVVLDVSGLMTAAAL